MTPRDNLRALHDLRAAYASGTMAVEEAALTFEAILMASDLDNDGMSRETPPFVNELINRMELIRFTVAEKNQRTRILDLLDEAAANLEQQL